jgi:hypothetical protein
MLFYEKLSYLLLIILAIILVFNSQITEKYEVYGEWNGELENYELFFDFKSNQKFNLNIKDKKSKTSSSIKGDFFVDYSKKPIALSFRNIPSMPYPLHTIIKFKGKNLIVLAEFSTREKFRPMIFKSENNIKIKRLIGK